jgi:hypothetical protein
MENENLNINEQFEKTMFLLVSAVSAIIRSMKDKDERVDAILKLNRSVEEWKKVHEAALFREDYETCEVIQQFINDVEKKSQ